MTAEQAEILAALSSDGHADGYVHSDIDDASAGEAYRRSNVTLDAFRLQVPALAAQWAAEQRAFLDEEMTSAQSDTTGYREALADLPEGLRPRALDSYESAYRDGLTKRIHEWIDARSEAEKETA